MGKASVAVAVIARNASSTIGALLDSVVPYVEQVVVCVDATTEDDTAAIALKHGAKVVQGHVVSEWHECPEHGRVLAQHFGRARDESFRLLPQTVDWLMWLDADDVLVGGDKLESYLADVPAPYVGIWLPYQYSSTPNGQASTRFDRERILRRSVGWEWVHRVHEVVKPIGRSSEEVAWLRTDEMYVLHQDHGHDNVRSAKRNILLLEIELEEGTSDRSWCLQYLGNQWFALEEWATAIHYFEESLQTPNVYQKWLTNIYRSMAYEKLGRLGHAAAAANDALALAPYHPEPYYRLAALAMLRGDRRACEWWTAVGDRAENAPSVVFANPMDRPYNARVTLGQAYFNDGEPTKARREWERAVEVVPNPTIQAGIEACKALEEDARCANNVVESYRGHTDLETRKRYSERHPENIWRFGRVRDVVVPALLRTRPNTQPRIVFWCGRAAEAWAPPSINGSGIGGSETAVIQIARRFQQAGWRADVYNEPDKYEGEYEGVGYWGLSRLGQEKADVLVGWRNPQAFDLPVSRHVSLLWCHDLNSGPAVGDLLPRWDRVLGVSGWHANYLASVYGLSNTDHVPNGIELDRFSADVARVPFRCVYASSPDRGLDRLLQMWPDVVAQEPTAELHVAYGWDTIDKYIAMGNSYLAALKAEITRLLERTPNVVWRGRLPQNELARLYQSAYCWTYPTSFLEVSCISAMEAMAGGAVPVTSAAGALPETIGEAGVVVKGNTYTQAWKEFYLLCLRAALADREYRLSLVEKGRERVKGLSWDAAFSRWEGIVTALLEGERVATTV